MLLKSKMNAPNEEKSVSQAVIFMKSKNMLDDIQTLIAGFMAEEKRFLNQYLDGRDKSFSNTRMNRIK